MAQIAMIDLPYDVDDDRYGTDVSKRDHTILNVLAHVATSILPRGVYYGLMPSPLGPSDAVNYIDGVHSRKQLLLFEHHCTLLRCGGVHAESYYFLDSTHPQFIEDALAKIAEAWNGS